MKSTTEIPKAKIESRKSDRPLIFGFWILASASLLALLALEVVGCGGLFQRSDAAPMRVVPRENQDVATLSADDVVRVMQRAGFSDEQIIELGTALRNALANAGGAEIQAGRRIEMAFAVKGEYLFATSRTRRTFMYSTASGRFGSMIPSGARESDRKSAE